VTHDELRLRHIHDAIRRIRTFITDEQSFLSSELVQDAVIRNLEVIGEAVKALSSEVRDEAPEVPWQQIARMRDHLIHRYHTVDLALVWTTVTNDLVALGEAVDRLLEPGA
jgi:uncharacterized protein with HEPN domain